MNELQASPHNPIRCLKENGPEVTYLKDGETITVYVPELFYLCPDCPWWWWHFDEPEDCRKYMAADMEKLGFKTTKCSRQLTFMDQFPKRRHIGIGAPE